MNTTEGFRPWRIDWCDCHLCHVTATDDADQVVTKQHFKGNPGQSSPPDTCPRIVRLFFLRQTCEVIFGCPYTPFLEFFTPAGLVPRLSVSHFPPLQFGAAYSSPAFSNLAFLTVSHFPVSRFQSPPVNIVHSSLFIVQQTS